MKGFLFVSWAALLLLGAAASANPLPECVLFVHVHPWQQDFCQTNPITECSQVVQHTTAEGDVEFDLFLDGSVLRMMGVPSYSRVAMEVRWPESWQFTAAESCRPGTLETEQTPEGAVLRFLFSSPVSTESPALDLIGRVRLSVQGFGSLESSHITLDEGPIGCAGGPAQAGVECEYCFLTCRYWEGCGASMTPRELALDVLQGWTAQGTILANIRYDGHFEPCIVEFAEDVPWMSLQVDLQNPIRAEILVTVDAEYLPLGLHEAWVRGVSECQDCVRVRVNVLDSTGVPGEPPEDPPVSGQTWGGIKNRYRR